MEKNEPGRKTRKNLVRSVPISAGRHAKKTTKFKNKILIFSNYKMITFVIIANKS